MSVMLDWSLYYIGIGWPVFPVGEDKVPMVKWTPYQTRTPTEEEVRRWWGQWPDANIGLATGAFSNVIVIDADDDKAVEVGLNRWNCLRVETGRGMHFYFRHPGERVKNRQDDDGFIIDSACFHVRGDGGYVVLPPSGHEFGIDYEWSPEWNPEGITKLPDDLREQLLKEDDDDEPDFTIKAAPRKQRERVSNEDRIKRYCESALERETQDLRDCPPGQRNIQLSKAAYSIGGLLHYGVIPLGDVENALFQAAKECGLKNKESWKTLKGQLAAGQKKARMVPNLGPARLNGASSSHSTGHVSQNDDLIPARELIRRYLKYNKLGQGLGFAWREDGKLYSMTAKRMITRSEVKELFPPHMMEVFKDWSVEYWACSNDPESKEKDIQKMPRNLWKAHSSGAYIELLNEMPDCPEDQVSIRKGANDIAVWIDEALNLPVSVQNDGVERPFLSTLVREAQNAHNIHWARVGHLDAWVKKGEQLAVRPATLKVISKKLIGIGDKALGRKITELGLGKIGRISIGNVKVRVYEMHLGMSADSLIESLESEPVQEAKSAKTTDNSSVSP